MDNQPRQSGLTASEELAAIDEVREEIKFSSRRPISTELKHEHFLVTRVPFVERQYDVHVNIIAHHGRVITYRVWQRPEDDAFETIGVMNEIPL